jgi:hypothetical protein
VLTLYSRLGALGSWLRSLLDTRGGSLLDARRRTLLDLRS